MENLQNKAAKIMLDDRHEAILRFRYSWFSLARSHCVLGDAVERFSVLILIFILVIGTTTITTRVLEAELTYPV